MEEHHLSVTKRARYFTIGGDPGRAAGEVWYVCHGYRQLARRFLNRFRHLATPERLIVAPEGLSRFYLEGGEGQPHSAEDRIGATWMTREDRETEIGDYVRYLDDLKSHLEGSSRPTRRLVLGFSQGVHTVCRWTALGSAKPDRLVLWGAYPPVDFPEDGGRALEGVDVVVVRGRADTYITDASHTGELSRMAGMGIAYREMAHSGGHALDGAVLETLSDWGG
jgi:predicted esterase